MSMIKFTLAALNAIAAAQDYSYEYANAAASAYALNDLSN